MLDSLLTPKTIAVIGASKTKGKVGYEILDNLIKDKFAGTVIPINPTATEILGVPCWHSLPEYGKPIDLSIVVVAAPAVFQAFKDSVAQQAKAVIIITAGFKEVDEKGAALEAEIAQYCKEHGVVLLGPNCLGLINTHHSMNASFASHMPPKGSISIISQSGALCTAILDWCVQRNMGLGKLVSIGNKADLNEVDFIRDFSRDPDTRVIVGYLENITDGNEFMTTAKQASAIKPIVIFKSGVTQAGGKAASSHTGSLAGADIAYGAAFRRSGVIRAETFENMLDYAIAFSMQPLPKGDNVAIITNAGGPGIMAADAVELSGLAVHPLQPETAAALMKKLPAAASVNNPIDVLGDADPTRYVDAVKAAQSDPTIDAIIVILTPQAMTDPMGTAQAIADSLDGSTPVLASFMGGLDVHESRALLRTLNIPEYPSPERAVDSLRAMRDYAAWLKRPPRIITRFPVNRRRVERILSRHTKTRQLQLGEASAKAILKAYDFNVPDGDIVSSSADAVALARQIGFPVAMKIASPDIIHKSDMGGVKLNLNNASAVEDAYDLMMLRMRQRAPGARIEGVYIEQMCPKGREVILGVTRDPQFGPMLMFGLGGIFVEVMKDVTFNIAPITQDEAMQMLQSTKSYELLKGVRGQAQVDMVAIADALQRISQLVTEFPQIAEMDINPFMVGRVGEISVAADARITLSGDDEVPHV